MSLIFRSFSLSFSFFSLSLSHTHTHILLPTDPSPFINLFTFFFSLSILRLNRSRVFSQSFWVLRLEGRGWKMSLWWCFGSTYSWDDDNSITNVWRFGSYPFYGLFPWDNSPSQKLTDTISNINKNINKKHLFLVPH